MSLKDGKLNRRQLLKRLGAGALLGSQILTVPEKAEAFYNALMLKKKGVSPVDPVSTIFSTNIYTGNGASQTITSGTDLATQGGLVWIKRRDSAASHALFDSARGPSNSLSADSMAVQTAGFPVAFSSTGFAITSSAIGTINANAGTYVAWSFRKAPKFFDLSAVTKTAGSNATVSFPDLETLGMVIVKRSDGVGSWYIWHRSMDAGNLIPYGTVSEAAMTEVAVSGTTVTLTNGAISDGSYVVYAWAHDAASNGNIYFGSLANGTSATTVTLGWEPQLIFYKANNSANWYVFDTTRGDTSGSQSALIWNTNGAEGNFVTQPYPVATGIYWPGGAGPNKVLLMAVRKP